MMKKLVLCSVFILCSWIVNGQVDNAVKQVIKPSIDSVKDAISKIQIPANVIWEEILILPVTRAGNIDTLTTPGIYVLSVEGSSSAVRYIHFYNGAIRTTNQMAWSGSGSWSTSVINGKVIVSTTATGITYKRSKL